MLIFLGRGNFPQIEKRVPPINCSRIFCLIKKEKGIPPISYFGGMIYSCKMIALRKRLEYAESTQFMREYVVVQAECDSKGRKTV